MNEVRKVQEIGKSLYISLPKNWTNQMAVMRGDKITLVPQKDGSIAIYPDQQEETPRQIDLEITDESLQSVKRRITGAYVDGFDIINLRTKKGFTDEQHETVRKVSEELFGLELVQAGLNTIVIECLLKSTLPVDKTINRIHDIITSMFDEMISSVRDHEAKLVIGLPRRIRDIKRLSTVIYRALRSLILYPTLASKEKMSLIDSVDFLYVLHRMTGTVYNIRNASESIAKIEFQDIPPTILKRLAEIIELTHSLYEKSIQALISKDIQLADYVLDTQPDFNDIENLCLQMNTESQITNLAFSQVQRIVDSLKQIVQNACEIAEIAIDRTEAETQK